MANTQNTNATNNVKMVTIKLPRTREEDQDVFVSVNGYSYVIKRGHEVEVPDFIAEVIRNQERAEMKAEEYMDSMMSK